MEARPSEQRLPLNVAENLRELYGMHTCDRRSSRSAIEQTYSFVQFQGDFSKHDTLWLPHEREPLENATNRLQRWLLKLFSTEDATFVSVISHAGAIRAMYQAIGHPDVLVARGAVIPVISRMTP